MVGTGLHIPGKHHRWVLTPRILARAPGYVEMGEAQEGTMLGGELGRGDPEFSLGHAKLEMPVRHTVVTRCPVNSWDEFAAQNTELG